LKKVQIKYTFLYKRKSNEFSTFTNKVERLKNALTLMK
jgi:hypothetical protein